MSTTDDRLETAAYLLTLLEIAGQKEINAKRKANRKAARKAKRAAFWSHVFENMAYADPYGLAPVWSETRETASAPVDVTPVQMVAMPAKGEPGGNLDDYPPDHEWAE